MGRLVTVAIPTLNGAGTLERTLAAVRAQQLQEGSELELLVCDSGSRDGSVALARRFGAELIEIPPQSFSHGGTRNLLMQRSQGQHVAFLTQDAEPADTRWLVGMLGGFSLADDVALSFGPYLPRDDASLMVARELTDWFRSFSPDGSPRIDRLATSERGLPARALLGPRGFFTDANGCLARAAWESVPFRPVRYAEDHVLAHDMLRAGYAKAFLPEAAVIHSHDYAAGDWLRRSFDEARAVHDVYGYVPPLSVRQVTLRIWGLVGADWRWRRAAGPAIGLGESLSLLGRSLQHHMLRTAGTLLGARADGLSESAVRHLSLEGRAAAVPG
ncbi:MAG: glycosyltransferase family 2 protein [Solirubrobacteraceae bacterium]